MIGETSPCEVLIIVVSPTNALKDLMQVFIPHVLSTDVSNMFHHSMNFLSYHRNVL